MHVEACAEAPLLDARELFQHAYTVAYGPHCRGLRGACGSEDGCEAWACSAPPPDLSWMLRWTRGVCAGRSPCCLTARASSWGW